MARKERIHYLDTLKVAIVYGIFVYHASLPFTWTSWLISSPQKSLVLTAFVLFCFPWGIPMMFLLAGSDSWFALRGRPAAAFLRARFLRLLLPLAAGMVLLSPLQDYLTRSGTSGTAAALLRSYPAFFRGIRLSWTPAWLGHYGYHLWFLGYLFAISVVLLPLLELLGQPAGRRAVAAAAAFCCRPGAIYVLVLPLAVSQLALRERYPTYEDWADIATYSLVFLAGYVIASERGFEPAIVRSVRLAFAVGVVSTAGVGGFLLAASWHVSSLPSLHRLLQPAYDLAWSLMIWSWVLVVLYVGIRWLNFESRLTTYLSESILPFYILHHPVVLLLGSIVVGLPLAVWPKFLLVAGPSLAVTMALYELLVRRWSLSRLLFGLKPKSRPAPRGPSAGSPLHPVPAPPTSEPTS